MIVNTINVLAAAKSGKYAVAHFNINNLEWTKYILEEANRLGQPVILGVSEGAKKYMGGFSTIVGMVEGLLLDLNIDIPVVLHLDHGSSFEVCKDAIDSGFSSVMIDASRLPFDQNVEITQRVVEYAHRRGVSVEAEIGHIAGSEDEVVSTGSTNATYAEAVEFVRLTGVDLFAPALGSVHGLYKGEPNLDFVTMKQISEAVSVPLVLHGASGIDDEKIRKAISCGISKINVNTEFQIVWHEKVLEFVKEHPDVYDPRMIISSGEIAMKKAIEEKILLFMGGENH